MIPAPDAIPVPWGWFYVLLMATFLLHLLVMNAMLGGGIIALLSTFQKKRQDLIDREFSYKWPYTIAFAVNMGVAPLLFIQVLYGHFIYTSSVLMAAWWFSIIALLIIAYYGAYIYNFKFDALGSFRILLPGLVVGILLFIGFLFTNNMTLMLVPDKWTAYFTNAQGRLLNLGDPTLIPRYLHMVVGAVVIGGLFLALTGHVGYTKSAVDKQVLIDRGLRYFTVATAIEIVLGLWFLLALPRDVMMVFMGQSIYGTLLLIFGMILAFAALYAGHKKQLIPACITAFLNLIVMVLMRDLVRVAYLEPYFRLSELTVRPEYSPMIFFFVIFVIGLGMMGYMLKLALDCRKEVTR